MGESFEAITLIKVKLIASVWAWVPTSLTGDAVTLKFAQYPSISMKLRVQNA